MNKLILQITLLSVETLAGTLACYFFKYIKKNQLFINIFLQKYLWLRLDYLNSTKRCWFTILEDLADYWSFKQLMKLTFDFIKFICLTQEIINFLQFWNGEPKDTWNSNLRTKRCPKSKNFYFGYGYGAYHSTCLYNGRYLLSNLSRKGRVAELYFLFKRNYSVECQPKENIIIKLNKIIEISNKYPLKCLNINLYSLLFYKELFYIAFENLKKKGEFNDSLLLKEFSEQWVTDLIFSLKNESFIFESSSKIKNFKFILKNEIMNEAIKILLEIVFAPTFSNDNHSFLKTKSYYTALSQIKEEFKTVNWIIKCDIINFNDKIDHSILMFIIKKRINDQRMLNLIHKFLNANFAFNFKTISYDIIGISKKDTLNYLLLNIFLNELDSFMFKKKEYINNKKKVQNNLKNLILTKSYNKTLNNDFSNLFFVRFAEDFIIGFNGSLNEAKSIAFEIEKFLINFLNLKCNQIIYNLLSDNIKFLGILINISKNCINTNKKKLLFFAPLIDIKNNLKIFGFINSKNIIIPKFSWFSKSLNEIILLYNKIIKSFVNYYSFVMNINKLVSLIWQICQISCAKLLASKLKLKTVSKVFKKFGNPIKIDDNTFLIKPYRSTSNAVKNLLHVIHK